ncbi:MAG: rod shape-determining protein MreD [Saprospiraceae bacterium]|nr:rod shape-determining protein MreD [Saprospiraceae bacterium]
MNSLLFQNITRWFLLVLMQVFILKQMYTNTAVLEHLHLLLYPLFIILLPIRTPNVLVMLLGFVTGLTVDLFYDSIGVHAAAAVFAAFIRPLALGLFEPREGYGVNQSPTKKQFGLGRFMGYASVVMVGFLFFYFSVEAFTFVYILDIFLNTLFSFIGTMLFVLIYMLIFDPVQ